MPLKQSGKLALKNFQEQYGKNKGKVVFYSFMSAHPKIKPKWEVKK